MRSDLSSLRGLFTPGYERVNELQRASEFPSYEAYEEGSPDLIAEQLRATNPSPAYPEH